MVWACSKLTTLLRAVGSSSWHHDSSNSHSGFIRRRVTWLTKVPGMKEQKKSMRGLKPNISWEKKVLRKTDRRTPTNLWETAQAAEEVLRRKHSPEDNRGHLPSQQLHLLLDEHYCVFPLTRSKSFWLCNSSREISVLPNFSKDGSAQRCESSPACTDLHLAEKAATVTDIRALDSEDTISNWAAYIPLKFLAFAILPAPLSSPIAVDSKSASPVLSSGLSQLCSQPPSSPEEPQSQCDQLHPAWTTCLSTRTYVAVGSLGCYSHLPVVFFSPGTW